MRRLILTIVFALSASATYAQDVVTTPAPYVYTVQKPTCDHPVLHWLIGAQITAQFADLGTSEFAFGTGKFHEANVVMRPFSHDPVVMSLAKAAVGIGTTMAALKLHRSHPGLATFVLTAMAGSAAYSAISNERAIHRK